MNPSTRRWVQLITVAGTLVLILGAGWANLTGVKAGLAVQTVAVAGNEVAVTVANFSQQPLTGTVVVRAASLNNGMTAAVPVAVPGGGRTAVRVALPEPISGGVTVGVVLDDGAPF